ncbi:hypothetical protein HY061_00095 [Candidatus Azambacteria bacterium]|nr:hypothetical protein [Candidatus Azambacteria bacterium]
MKIESRKSFKERIAFHQIPVMGTRFSGEKARQLFIANLKKSDPKESQSEWLCLVFKKTKEITN